MQTLSIHVYIHVNLSATSFQSIMQTSWKTLTTDHIKFNPLRPSDACICVGKLTIIGSDNGLSPGRRQAIIWTNAGILLIRTLGTNFNEILSEIQSFSFSKMHLKMSSAKWRLFGIGFNELMLYTSQTGRVFFDTLNVTHVVSSYRYCKSHGMFYKTGI